MRYTEYHAGKAAIKDRSLLSEAMEKLARLEDAEDTNVLSKWIPCSERLPEENTNVIACFSNGTVTELAFYNGEFHGLFSHTTKVIVAWMPLPKPYREENSEEIKDDVKPIILDELNGDIDYECPLCGKQVMSDAESRNNYCGKCGCKFDLSEIDETN